jgi:hypothetical protein
MKLVATVVCALCLLAGGAAAKGTPVLGMNYTTAKLGWYDSTTLQPLPGRKVLMRSACIWAFSPTRALLAYSSCDDGTLAFVNARVMRAAGTMDVGGLAGQITQLSWLRADRMLAVVTRDGTSTLAVVDPVKRKVVRRVELPGPVTSRSVLRDGHVAYLVGHNGSFGPARVAVADADGDVQTATLDRITVGSVFDEQARTPTGQMREAGFAVDVEGNRAFVVSPSELLVAEVDLGTLVVGYHGTSRTLSKVIEGPTRDALWLGDGMLAIAGADFHTAVKGGETTIETTPYGLQLVDTRTWTSRTVDPRVTYILAVPGGGALALLGPDDRVHQAVAWGGDGAVRYRLTVPAHGWVDVAGSRGVVCSGEHAVRVVDAASGRTLGNTGKTPCIGLLNGPASPP